MYIYIYMYICVCVCVSVYACIDRSTGSLVSLHRVDRKLTMETCYGTLTNHVRGPSPRLRASRATGLGFAAVQLWDHGAKLQHPEEPTFLGFLVMISLYESLKTSVLSGPQPQSADAKPEVKAQKP